jgi:hypothetical protein
MPNRAEPNAATPEAVLTPARPESALASVNDPNELPRPREIGGPTGPEPTRFGDWEKKGRCIDF